MCVCVCVLDIVFAAFCDVFAALDATDVVYFFSFLFFISLFISLFVLFGWCLWCDVCLCGVIVIISFHH